MHSTISPELLSRFDNPRHASPSLAGPSASWAGDPRSGLAFIELLCPSGPRPSAARFKAHGSPWLIAMADLCCERCENLFHALGWDGLEEGHVLLDRQKMADFFAALRAEAALLEAPSWEAASLLIPQEALARALSAWASQDIWQVSGRG